MRTLYDNAFSPFARKVRMVLEHKGLAFDAVDGLSPAGRDRLAALNPRVEVPVLVDGDAVVVNSSHIVAYLEPRHPARASSARSASSGAAIASSGCWRMGSTTGSPARSAAAALPGHGTTEGWRHHRAADKLRAR